jgi:outer membrane protein assembly factor BamB
MLLKIACQTQFIGKKKMKSVNKKTKASLIAIILMLTITTTSIFVSLPSANANNPPFNVPTYSYVTVAPNPVGIGQTVTVAWWLDKLPPGAAGNAGERYIGQTLEIIAPDGTSQTITLPPSDPVGCGYTKYTPDQVGTYTLKFKYPGQVITGKSGSGIYVYNIAINDTYLASNATATFTAQEDAISDPPVYPLPTEYWARPIEGQNNAWSTISSNWLSGAAIFQKVQPDGIAPNSAHIMWSMPVRDGGVVGGNRTGTEGMTYYDGTHYETLFKDPIVMYGRLYFTLPAGSTAGNGGYICVDLRTGEKIWYSNKIGVSGSAAPSFGQLYDYESMNQHGVIPNGYLWSNNFATAFDPLTGEMLFNMTSVPTGTEVYTNKGEIVRYVLNDAGKWLALWNNTAAYQLTNTADPNDLTSTNYNQWRPIGKSVNMSTAYSWNVTLSWLPTGSSIQAVIHEDVLLGRTGSLPSTSSWTPYTMWAMSLKPESRGTLLWTKTYDAPLGNISRSFRFIDEVNRVFIFWDKETVQYLGYNLDDGTPLWTTASEAAFNMYAGGGGSIWTQTTAYGKLYSCGYSGMIYCYDTESGNLLWNYSTAVKAGFSAPYGGYPIGLVGVADGQIYFHVNEHSSGAPYWKGAELYCLDATSGEEIWTLAFHGSSGYPPWGYAIADGYLVGLNLYDMQMYSIGKGPSATTVSASPKVSVHGSSVLIEGSVIDTAPGTKQKEQAARFPNGVPAISDANMGKWMEYVYMQKPKPTNAIGVEVIFETLDPNGNNYEIGRTTSDANGMYKFAFKPEVPGLYTIIAKFAGSNSYWPSQAETAINVDEVPSATTVPTPLPVSIADTYFVPALAGIFIFIAIIGAIIILMLRKRP